MLTPADINNKEFTRSFRGYDEDEIDTFLDQVIHDYEQLFKENAELKGQAEQGGKDLANYRQIEKSLRDTLLIAQKKADELVAQAKKDAEGLLTAAHKEADELRESTQQSCAALRQQAEQDAQHEIELRQEQLTETRLKYEAIVKKQRQFLTKIKSLLRTELDLLNEDGVQQIVGDLTTEMELDFGAKNSAAAKEEVPAEPTAEAAEESEPSPAAVPTGEAAAAAAAAVAVTADEGEAPGVKSVPESVPGERTAGADEGKALQDADRLWHEPESTVAGDWEETSQRAQAILDKRRQQQTEDEKAQAEKPEEEKKD